MLEQLIIKYKADFDCISIRKTRKGLDFHYLKRSQGLKFISFLKNMVPIRSRANNRHLSCHDNHSNKYDYKYNYLVEIAPLCKDDLVILKNNIKQSAWGSESFQICISVARQIQLIDPTTLEITQINSKQYWDAPFRPVMSSNQLRIMMVLNIEIAIKYK